MRETLGLKIPYLINYSTPNAPNSEARKLPSKPFTRRSSHCEACPRLRKYCQGVAKTKRRAYQNENYWGKPITGFGDPDARLFIVGLAPAAHGANRTGRIFTGDRSGDWLYRAHAQGRLRQSAHFRPAPR